MRIEISCAKCGANRFDFPEHLTDVDLVRCASCDHEIGTLGQLKERVAAAVLAHRRAKRHADRKGRK